MGATSAILAYTCAGGYDGPSLEGKTFFLDMTARRRLLARGMSLRPDLVIANGDHIYWDMKTSRNKPTAAFAREQLWTKVGGPFDLSVPMPTDTYGTLGAERTAWDSNRLSGPKLLDLKRLLHCRMGWLGGRDSNSEQGLFLTW